VRRSRHVYTNDDLAIYAHERQGNTVQATETPSANPANPAQAGTEASGTQTPAAQMRLPLQMQRRSNSRTITTSRRQI